MITENGQPRTITSVTCPPDTVKSLSVCIMVDTYGYGLIKLAQAGTQRLINYLKPPKDEIAITMMNQGVQIHRDFTSDTAKALASASTIPPAPGYVDVQRMFYYPNAGGVPFISGRSSDKKVLILVSDLHCPQLNLDETKLYQDAAQQNIAVYTVLLGTTDYSGLFKRVAARTGGKVFENVKTETQITNIFQEIERKEHYIPCEITWESGPNCFSTIPFELTWKSASNSITYGIPDSKIARLLVDPPFVNFGKKPLSSITDTLITLTANNADFTVNDMKLKFGSGLYSIVNVKFPLIIPKNTSKEITFRYRTNDSSTNYSTFEISTNLCPMYISGSSSLTGKPSKTPSIKLVKPNGGEGFTAGSDTLIQWEGVSPGDTVSLEFSSDNGQSWKRITDEATGLRYIWRNVPLPPSSKCLVRIRQRSADSEDSVLQLVGHNDRVLSNSISSLVFSPDGTRVATGSKDSTVKIWDAHTGTLLFDLKHVDEIGTLKYSPDNKQLVAKTTNYQNQNNNGTNVWNTNNGSLLYKFYDSPFGNSLYYSNDSKYIAKTSRFNNIKLHDAATGAYIRDIGDPKLEFSNVYFSPDGSRIVSRASDSTIKIWDTSGNLIHSLIPDNYTVASYISFSPDGSLLAMGGGILRSYFIQIWDVASGVSLHTLMKRPLSKYDDSPHLVMFNQTGTQIISYEPHYIKTWDVRSGLLYSELEFDTNRYIPALNFDGTLFACRDVANEKAFEVLDVRTGNRLYHFINEVDYFGTLQFSPDGSQIASINQNSTVSIWNIVNPLLQEDQSDAVFSIIAPEPTLQNLSIDMGKVLVGQSKDSTVLSIVCNKGLAPLHVLGIDITSGDSTDFSIPRGAGDFFLDSNKQCQDVMFGFAPTKVGKWTAKATVRTTVGNFIDTIIITGEGIAPSLAIVTPFIDFGQTFVGKPKDSNKVITIKNVGSSDMTITQIDYNAVNTTNFSTLAGGNPLTLQPNKEAIMDLRFLPNDDGRKSGILQFHYNGVGSPATVQLFGEGLYLSTTVKAQDIPAQAGEKVNLLLKFQKQSGMQMVGAPTEWYARIIYNKSILFNEQTSNVCPGTTDSCVLELTGVYNPKTDELISIPCIATLGNTDHSTIVIDTFYWKNSVIATDVATQNGTITITNVCEDGGVRLFIPAKNSTSLSSRPNPVQDKLQIHYGLREPLTVTLELLNITGQVVQTIVNNQSQTSGQYTLTSDLSLLGNGVYLLRLRTNKEMLTTRVDVVK